jgi:hypothetical protein
MRRVNSIDFGITAAIVMLVIWAVATVAFEAPGWLHILLTVGVFLLIHRIVVRGTPDPVEKSPRK